MRKYIEVKGWGRLFLWDKDYEQRYGRMPNDVRRSEEEMCHARLRDGIRVEVDGLPVDLGILT